MTVERHIEPLSISNKRTRPDIPSIALPEARIVDSAQLLAVEFNIDVDSCFILKNHDHDDDDDGGS
ncbi:hypothetical protein KIN20_013647 [Parelaphostrongylus tenuis]|uniref:Uncharacterized protein n=1 Tax=Parelaphostrongylus tenuis TaxID=148309 RepID=A0AAD5MUT6_PARTN|nr:hypothetical protein KIN20_013647 [Parelaphostrongylus tenuis]